MSSSVPQANARTARVYRQDAQVRHVTHSQPVVLAALACALLYRTDEAFASMADSLALVWPIAVPPTIVLVVLYAR